MHRIRVNSVRTLLGAPFLGLLLLAVHAVPLRAADEAPIHLTPGAPPASPEVTAALAELDRELFEAVFSCKLEALPRLVADDLEFLHDKGGRVAGSGKEFIAQVTAGCARQAAGTDFRARRELVPGSMSVYLLAHYGAMQMGTHRFYAVVAGKPDRLTESGRFIDVWRQDGATWKLARVISYDHHLAE